MFVKKRHHIIGGLVAILLCAALASGGVLAAKSLPPLQYAEVRAQLPSEAPGKAFAFLRTGQGDGHLYGPYPVCWPAMEGYPLLQSDEGRKVETELQLHTVTRDEVAHALVMLANIISLDMEIQLLALEQYLELAGMQRVFFADLLTWAEAVGIDINTSARNVLNGLQEAGLFRKEEILSLFTMMESNGLFLDEDARSVFLKADELGLFVEISAKSLFLFAVRHNLDLNMFSQYLDVDFISQHLAAFIRSLGLTLSEDALRTLLAGYGITLDVSALAQSVENLEDHVKLEFAIGTHMPSFSGCIGPDFKSSRRKKQYESVAVEIETPLTIAELVVVAFYPSDAPIHLGKVERNHHAELAETGPGSIRALWTVPLKKQKDYHTTYTFPWHLEYRL